MNFNFFLFFNLLIFIKMNQKNYHVKNFLKIYHLILLHHFQFNSKTNGLYVLIDLIAIMNYFHL